jgi:diphthine-ammonia ligase
MNKNEKQFKLFIIYYRSMCGISLCIYGYNLPSLSHRGPDAEASLIKDNLKFTHNLLSIVGENIKQPFEGQGIFLSNCEIYNWKELCIKYGIKAKNDAEFLFKYLESQDKIEIKKLMDELDGDYACIYYRDNTIYAFRDPLGVFPLFYSLNPLLFSSERNDKNLIELHPRTILIHNIKTKETKWENYDFFSNISSTSSYKEINSLLSKSVEKRIIDNPIILFSGGIDSQYLALKSRELNKEPILITSYSDKSEDIKYARDFCEEYSFKLNEIEFTKEKIEKDIEKIMNRISSCDSVKVGIAIPIYYACFLSQKFKSKVIFSGSGADEIFGGYHRFKAENEIKNELLSSLRDIYERDLYRNNSLSMTFSKEMRVPYLDKSLVLSSLALPREELYEKKILRDILKNEFNIEERYYMRPKKAAQYGTKSMKLLRSLSSKNITSHLFNLHENKNIKLGALYTGGKDSAYALYLMKQRNYEISCLISIKSKNQDSYMYHTPEIDRVKEHAEKMNIPLILIETSGEKEEELKQLKEALEKAKEKYKIEGVITGALFSEYQRQRIEKISDKIGLRVFSPLWHVDQELHMRRLLKDKFKFIFTKVAAEGLDNSWLNREITEKDIDELIKLNKKYGVNVAGEGGEFESFVVDCPLFK